MREAGDAYQPGEGQAFHSQVVRDGKAYQAVLTPISFPGWSLVTVVPESEFLGPVQMTIRKLLIGLAVLIVFAGLLSAWLAQRRRARSRVSKAWRGPSRWGQPAAGRFPAPAKGLH